jgi:hypothetical protein
MKLVRSSVSIVCGLPRDKVGSAPAIVFSGPAQRSLALWPARSPSHLVTLSIESSDSFVASAAVSIATGWSEPVPGRELHPLKSSAFHGALYRQLLLEILIAEPKLENYSEDHVAYKRNPRCPHDGHTVDEPRAAMKYIEAQTQNEKDVCQ